MQVLLDIPLFMSHHREKMIEAVCLQANKLYRLWIARNPDFEKNGRVHIIGHSVCRTRILSISELTFSSALLWLPIFCRTSPRKCPACPSCQNKSLRRFGIDFSSIRPTSSCADRLSVSSCTLIRLKSCREKVEKERCILRRTRHLIVPANSAAWR